MDGPHRPPPGRARVRDALDAERMRLAAEVADQLTGSARDAVGRLRRIVAEGADRDAVNAARVLLDQMTRHRDHAWVSDRLAALEDAAAPRSGAA